MVIDSEKYRCCACPHISLLCFLAHVSHTAGPREVAAAPSCTGLRLCTCFPAPTLSTDISEAVSTACTSAPPSSLFSLMLRYARTPRIWLLRVPCSALWGFEMELFLLNDNPSVPFAVCSLWQCLFVTTCLTNTSTTGILNAHILITVRDCDVRVNDIYIY